MMVLPLHYLMSLDRDPLVFVMIYDDSGFKMLESWYNLN